MPSKGTGRRSTRGAKPASGTDHLSSTGAYDEPSTTPTAGSTTGGGSKGKRGTKARTGSYQYDEPKSAGGGRGSKQVPPPSPPEDTAKEDDEDDNGITRCLCDEVEAETKDMGFMVQCESCDVWQHGICMGIAREEDCPEQYYCDECRPDLHKAVLEELARRQLAASQKSHKKHKSSSNTQSHHVAVRQASSSRTSRSITPAERDRDRETSNRRQSSTLPSQPPPGSASSSNKLNPKRRSTMNSAARGGPDGLDGGDDPEMKLALDISLKEAQSLGIVAADSEQNAGKDRDAPSSAGPGEDDGGSGSGTGTASKKKRKRVTGETDENASRRKRSAGSPDSTRSEHGINEAHSGAPSSSALLRGASQGAKGSGGNSGAKGSPALVAGDISVSTSGTPMGDAPPPSTTGLGRGRRGKKDKDDTGDGAGKPAKQPNQYTYRDNQPGSNASGNASKGSAAANLANTSSNTAKPSPHKTAKNDHHGHGHGRKGPAQSSRGGHGKGHNSNHHNSNNHNSNEHSGNSPSPVPLSYNIPDHFSHLAPLLPNPTPLGVSVPVRVELVAVMPPPPAPTSKTSTPPASASLPSSALPPALLGDEANEKREGDEGDPSDVKDGASSALDKVAEAAVAGVLTPVEPLPSNQTRDGLTTRTFNQIEKGVKVRWPPKRTTIGEMRRRVRSMMEYVARAQLDAGERERRVEMLRSARELALSLGTADSGVGVGIGLGIIPTTKAKNGGKGKGRSKGKDAAEEEDAEMADGDSSAVHTPLATTAALKKTDNAPLTVITSSIPSTNATSSLAVGIVSGGPSTTTSSTSATSTPTTTQLLDEITRELINFQERFGAARETKVFRERAETRERRARGAGTAVEAEMF